MAFAKGMDIKKQYMIVYDVLDEGKINIHSCKPFRYEGINENIYIQVVNKKQDVEKRSFIEKSSSINKKVSDEEMKQAIEAYLSGNAG